jgi:hypothetical protein
MAVISHQHNCTTKELQRLPKLRTGLGLKEAAKYALLRLRLCSVIRAQRTCKGVLYTGTYLQEKSLLRFQNVMANLKLRTMQGHMLAKPQQQPRWLAHR